MKVQTKPLGKLVPRTKQPEYLTARGLDVTYATLGIMACRGTGPKYVKVLGQCCSYEAWLDEWVEGLTSVTPPSAKASVHKEARRKRQRELMAA